MTVKQLVNQRTVGDHGSDFRHILLAHGCAEHMGAVYCRAEPAHAAPSRSTWVSKSNNRLTVAALEPELSSPPPAEITDGISTTGRVLSATASACCNSKIYPLHRGMTPDEELKS